MADGGKVSFLVDISKWDFRRVPFGSQTLLVTARYFFSCFRSTGEIQFAGRITLSARRDLDGAGHRRREGGTAGRSSLRGRARRQSEHSRQSCVFRLLHRCSGVRARRARELRTGLGGPLWEKVADRQQALFTGW